MTEYRIVERTWINSEKFFFIEYKGWFGIWHRLGISMNYDSKKDAEKALNAHITPDVMHEFKIG